MSRTNGFTDNPDLYRRSEALANKGDLEVALAHLPDPDGMEVLDVGTGTGHTAFFFAEQQAQVFGVDPDAGMLEVAQEESDGKTLRCRFLRGSAEDLPFDDQAFDLVCSRQAAHHFIDLSRFLQEAHRVLKPAGRLLLIDNVVPSEDPASLAWLLRIEQARDPSHRHTLTCEAWKELFLSHNFSLEYLEQMKCPLNFELWMSRQSVPAETSKKIWEMIETAPADLKEALNPQSGPKGQTLNMTRMLAIAAKVG